MKFTSAVLSLLAATGIASAGPVAGGGGGDWGTTKGHVTSSCWTSSTCKAEYYTKPVVKESPYTVIYTKTEYKPTKVETEAQKVYTKTKYSKTSPTKSTNCFPLTFPFQSHHTPR